MHQIYTVNTVQITKNNCIIRRQQNKSYIFIKSANQRYVCNGKNVH